MTDFKPQITHHQTVVLDGKSDAKLVTFHPDTIKIRLQTAGAAPDCVNIDLDLMNGSKKHYSFSDAGQKWSYELKSGRRVYFIELTNLGPQWAEFMLTML